MSGYLLDTNAFSMMLSGDPRLPKASRDRLESADRIAVSVISFYEIGQKVRRGNWPEMEHFSRDMLGRSTAEGYDVIALTAGAAEKASMLEWAHRDPFDRMIAAVAMIEDLELISSDQAFDLIAVSRRWS